MGRGSADESTWKAVVANVAGKVVGGHEEMHQCGERGSGMPQWGVATRDFALKEGNM
jgi:hypothetical protein